MMNDWIDVAVLLLKNSLKPLPQELNELDWKTNLSDKSERLAQHISAFANCKGGGFLAFGINNEGVSKPLTKVEVDDIVKKIGNVARHNLAQPIGVDHAVIDFNNDPILFIHIPEHLEKPVYLRGGDLFDSYKRSAGQTVKLSKHEVGQLLATSSGFDFEDQIAMANVGGDEVFTLLDYDSYFTLQEKRLPETTKGILNILANDGLIRKSHELWDITNLGALMFTKDMQKFKDLRRKAVRVVVYSGDSRVNAVKEQVGVKGYASGFEGLVSYIMDQLPSNEVIETALRRKVKMYPEVAVREFVANALIHQDLTIRGAGIMIEIFNDRIEITNPGSPLVDTNRFIDAAPKSRNEILASIMRRLNICEERGSGVDRAVQSIEDYQLPAPKFIKGDGYTRVIMYAPTQLTRMNNEDRIRACYQHTCLHYVNNQPVNNQSVRKRFNISKNNVSFASKIIAETIDSGLIKSSDPESASKKYASYVPFWT
ncbi:ATP-binding protein [Pedobacter sp. AW31-3R]|uniref:ATP-binding protein n=1 Tax=Pedobacter sp. AW31-3R TaxID=3445781 RepID=UPI003F9F9799